LGKPARGQGDGHSRGDRYGGDGGQDLRIGLRHLLAFSRNHKTISAPASAIMEINILQVLAAHNRVFL